MHFDVFTALIASTSVLFVLSAVLAVFWKRNPKNRWLMWWAMAYLVLGVGNTLVIVSPETPRAGAFAAGSAVFLLGFGLMWQATRVFEGRKPRLAAMFAAIALWSGLLLLPVIQQDLFLRVAMMSFPLAGALALAASEIWRGRREELPFKRTFAALLLAVAAIIAARVPFGALAAYPVGARPINDIAIIVLIGGLIVTTILLAVLVISLSLERAEQGQRHLAATDPLTGLLNRRGLDAVFDSGKLPEDAAVIVFDLDRFKQVNDSFGHAAGDALIAAFGLICREELRKVDQAARLGGEEFALILMRTDWQAAEAVAERIRDRYARNVVAIEGGAIAGTVSGGIYCGPDKASVWLSGALAEADRAMYRAKAAGRNRVFSDAEIASGSRGFDKRCVAPEVGTASA